MADVTVNKARLAHWLGVSLTTLAKWMLKYGAAFPIVERGGNGRDYVFDPNAVADFLRARQEEQAAARSADQAAVDEQLAQLRLPFDLPNIERPPAASSAKEELMAWELRKRQRLEAEASGKLIPAEATRSALAAMLGRLSRDSHAFLRQVGREQGLPEAVIATIIKRWSDQQRATVAAARAELHCNNDADL